jgi:hypothetical protein
LHSRQPRSKAELIGYVRQWCRRHGIRNAEAVWATVGNHLLYGGDIGQLAKAMDLADYIASVHYSPCQLEPEPEQVSGDIPLGTTVINKVPYNLNSKEPVTHMAMPGATQRGKTTLGRRIYRAAEGKVNVWFDDVKGDHEHLVKDFPDTLAVIRPSSKITHFKMNPLELDGIPPQQWIAEFTEIFCNTQGLLEGSSSLIERALFDIFRQKSLSDGSENYPTMHELLAYIERMDLNRHTNYRQNLSRDSVVPRLRSVLNPFGDCFNCTKGHPMEALAKHDIVWAFQDATKTHRAFFSAIKNYKLLHWRKSRNIRGVGVKNIIIIEEAKDQFDISHDMNHSIGLSKASHFVTLCAEFGIMLIALDQDFGTRISQVLKDNTGIKILLGVYGGDNIRGIAADMDLTPEQKQLNYELPLSMFMVRDKRFPHVFCCTFSDYPIVKDMKPEELDAAAARWLSTLPWTAPKPGEIRPKESQNPEMQKKIQMLLNNVYSKPWLASTERQESFCSEHRFEKDEYYELREICISQKLLKQISTNPTGGKGKNIALMELTPAGYQLISRKPYKPGVEHQYLQRFVKSLAEQRGFLAELEKTVNGIRVDVLLTKQGRRCAVEVALDDRYEIGKLPALISHADKVFLLCRNKDIVKRLSRAADQAIAPEKKQEVEITIISDAYKHKTFFD